MRISSVFFDKLRKLDLPLGIFSRAKRPFMMHNTVQSHSYCGIGSHENFRIRKNEVTLCKI